MSFGIDFGTANSVLAKFDGKNATAIPLDKWNLDNWQYPSFEKLFPTVVGYRSTWHEPLFGWEAKLRSEESFAAVKRLLKGDERVHLFGKEYTAPTVVAGFFDALRHRAAEQGLDISEAVVTVPANATGAARFRTRAAARIGRIQVQALLNEPTAAAIAYVHDMGDTAERILVFDWGGGTVDVTVLQYNDQFGLFEEQASRGITELGGLELDARLERLVLRKLGREPDWTVDEYRQFHRDIERTKIRLSTEEFAHMTTPDFSKTIGIERAEFEAEISDLITRSSEPLRACLADLRIDPSELDAILMVGGTSQIPLVRARVEDILDAETVSPDVCDPMTAVARGAAIAAAILDGELDSDLSVATTHALGTVSTKDGHRTFSQIIPRNAALPRRQSKTYEPQSKNQSAVLLEVWEGDPKKPLDDPENFLLAKVRVSLPQRFSQQQNTFSLTYTYDTDGLLHVKAETADGHKLLDENVERFGVQESGANVTPDSLQQFLKDFSFEFSATAPSSHSPLKASEVDAHTLKNDDPIWEQHSGDSGHSGVEWDESDLVLAKDLYAALPDHTRFVFGLMIDRPGERISADFIAEQLSNWPGRTLAYPANRHSVSSSLVPFTGPHNASGRRLPFYWWRVNHGPTLYAMKPTVARLFGDARRASVANGLTTSP